MTWKTTRALPLLAIVLGCSSGPAEEARQSPAGDPAAQQRPATASDSNTLPIPGVDSPRQPGDEPQARGQRLNWTVPASWAEEQPQNSIRLAQYRVPGTGGDAECVVFYFGPGQGGDPNSNAHRWAGQFSQPDGRPSTEVMKLEQTESASVPYHLVEVTGTFEGGMTSTEPQAGYMLLGGIAQGGDAPWFFKLIGPETTVRENRDAFLSMMESIEAN